jgi:hypothetical protein
VFNADEHLAGRNPTRGTELCTVVETMYSASYTYQAFGNNSIADLAERMAFNALPATLTSSPSFFPTFAFAADGLVQICGRTSTSSR